jgi:hypothetical protein
MNFIENFTSELAKADLDVNLVLATFYKSVAMTQKDSTFHILSKEEKSMLDSALFEQQCANEYDEAMHAQSEEWLSEEEELERLYLEAQNTVDNNNMHKGITNAPYQQRYSDEEYLDML